MEKHHGESIWKISYCHTYSNAISQSSLPRTLGHRFPMEPCRQGLRDSSFTLPRRRRGISSTYRGITSVGPSLYFTDHGLRHRGRDSFLCDQLSPQWFIVQSAEV